MHNVWLASSVWLALALAASIISIRVAISVALIEIVVGAIAGNTIGLEITPWVNFLAGFGAILLTFLAGTEIEMKVIRNNLGASVGIGVVRLLRTLSRRACLCALRHRMGMARGANRGHIDVDDFGCGRLRGHGRNRLQQDRTWQRSSSPPASSTIWEPFWHSASCLRITMRGSLCSARLPPLSYGFFPRFAPWFFKAVGHRVSEPETKFVSLVLLSLGGLSQIAGSEAVLPAYLIGMALAPSFLKDQELGHRFRIIAFTILTPFYFLKAGSLVDFSAVASSAGLIAVFLLDQNGNQVRGDTASDEAFQFRAEGGDVYDAAHVHGAHLRLDLRAVRPHQSHHRSAGVHDPGHSRDRQRGGADADCAAMVHANFKADGCTWRNKIEEAAHV